MTRKKLGILTPAPALAAGAVVMASLAVSDPGSLFAVPFIGVVGILLTRVFANQSKDGDVAQFLGNVMLLGFAARLVLFAFIHQTVGPYLFAPDQVTYEGWGDDLLAYLVDGARFPRRLENTLQLAYPMMNAGLYFLFGEARAAPSMLNMLMSSWTAIPIYYLTLAVVRQNHGVARTAAVLVVFFPSMILWSTLNVREAPTILIISFVLLFLVRSQQRPNLVNVGGAIAGLALLTLFREYLSPLIGLAGVAGVMMGQSKSPVRALVAGSVVMIVLTYIAQSFGGVGTSLTGEPTLEQAQLLREAFQMDAGSAYGQGADVSTAQGALTYLPIGLSYFMLAPFPWSIGSALQAITLPETLVWYSLIPFSFIGARLALRHDPSSYTVPTAILIIVTFSYALVEANVGTAYRHRAQVLPIVFVFIAVGLRDRYAVWTQRRRDRLDRQRRVAATLGRPGVPRRTPPPQSEV